MKTRLGTMALFAIMILCSAMTCSGGEELDERYTSEGYLELRGTTWESTSLQSANQGYNEYEGRKTLTITFRDGTYDARLESYTTDAYGNHISGPMYYYGGNFELSDTFIEGKYYIYCYDGTSKKESIRFEVMSHGSVRMEGYVYFTTLDATYRVVMEKL